jgi:hypothetical protein
MLRLVHYEKKAEIVYIHPLHGDPSTITILQPPQVVHHKVSAVGDLKHWPDLVSHSHTDMHTFFFFFFLSSAGLSFAFLLSGALQIFADCGQQTPSKLLLS